MAIECGLPELSWHIVWVREPEHIQWPLRREREEKKRGAKLLILCGLESLNTHNATSSAGILYGLESLNTYNGH